MLCPPRLTGEQRTLITRGIDGDPPDPAGRATACSRGVVDRASRSDPGVDRGGRDLGGRVSGSVGEGPTGHMVLRAAVALLSAELSLEAARSIRAWLLQHSADRPPNRAWNAPSDHLLVHPLTGVLPE
jgi:hypothetical protein